MSAIDGTDVVRNLLDGIENSYLRFLLKKQINDVFNNTKISTALKKQLLTKLQTIPKAIITAINQIIKDIPANRYSNYQMVQLFDEQLPYSESHMVNAIHLKNLLNDLIDYIDLPLTYYETEDTEKIIGHIYAKLLINFAMHSVDSDQAKEAGTICYYLQVLKNRLSFAHEEIQKKLFTEFFLEINKHLENELSEVRNTEAEKMKIAEIFNRYFTYLEDPAVLKKFSDVNVDVLLASNQLAKLMEAAEKYLVTINKKIAAVKNSDDKNFSNELEILVENSRVVESFILTAPTLSAPIHQKIIQNFSELQYKIALMIGDLGSKHGNKPKEAKHIFEQLTHYLGFLEIKENAAEKIIQPPRKKRGVATILFSHRMESLFVVTKDDDVLKKIGQIAAKRDGIRKKK